MVNNNNQKNEKLKGIKMKVMSLDKVKGDTIAEKMETVLESVKEGEIIILDQALGHEDEARLVTNTMENIDAKFSGIEFFVLRKEKHWALDKILGSIISLFELITRRQFPQSGVTFVGPHSLIKEVKRDPDAFSVEL